MPNEEESNSLWKDVEGDANGPQGSSVAGQLLYLELQYVRVSIAYMCEKDHRPAVKEKLAASLILLRVPRLLGLSIEAVHVALGGGDGGLAAESSGSDALSATAATSGSPLTDNTRTEGIRISVTHSIRIL